MPRVRLTDLTVSKLPHSKAQITFWDERLPAFGVRVGARRKTFIVIVKPGQRIKLRNYPFKSLRDARREAYKRLSDRSGLSAEADAQPAGELSRSSSTSITPNRGRERATSRSGS